jgi:6,7-dimethyl-8-ribityllumazine synthase
MRFAVIMSRFNPEVTEGLLQGALNYLGSNKLDASVFEAPGAFEIPLLARELARTGKYSGVIALGCVIKGDTAHFEFISLGATIGIQQAALETGVPIAFGILTTYTDEQAIARSRRDAHNKGIEAATACHESALLLEGIRSRRRKSAPKKKSGKSAKSR